MCLLMGDKLHPHVQLMIDLGKAMADERLPKDSSIQPPEQRVDRCWAELVMPPRSPSHWIPGCIQALKEAAGEEVLAEAAAVVAMFSAMTIVVDDTCCEPHVALEEDLGCLLPLHRLEACAVRTSACPEKRSADHQDNCIHTRFPIGLEQQIASWSIDQLRSFHSRWYVPENATLFIVGDIDEEETIQKVEQAFSQIPKAGLKTGEPWDYDARSLLRPMVEGRFVQPVNKTESEVPSLKEWSNDLKVSVATNDLMQGMQARSKRTRSVAVVLGDPSSSDGSASPWWAKWLPCGTQSKDDFGLKHAHSLRQCEEGHNSAELQAMIEQRDSLNASIEEHMRRQNLELPLVTDPTSKVALAFLVPEVESQWRNEGCQDQIVVGSLFLALCELLLRISSLWKDLRHGCGLKGLMASMALKAGVIYNGCAFVILDRILASMPLLHYACGRGRDTSPQCETFPSKKDCQMMDT
eukprot:g11619.t1